MAKKTDEGHGASPLPKGNHKPLFKAPDTAAQDKDEKKQRDITGQTDTALKHMNQRLREVPKKSAGSEHDKTVYEKKERRKHKESK